MNVPVNDGNTGKFSSRQGMAYGKHVDNALMGPKGGRERSDVSITVFISDIDEYDGGELVIHSPFGVQEVKLPSGSVVVYPSSSLHEVTEVTRGERLVAVTWAQRGHHVLSELAARCTLHRVAKGG